MKGRSFVTGGNDRRRKAIALGILVTILWLILLGRLYALQVLGHEQSREQARRNWLKPEFVPGLRGRILDRNGAILAEMVPSFSVVVDPNTQPFLRDAEALDRSLSRLAELVDGDASRYRETVDRQKRITYKPIRLVRNIDPAVVARIEENRSRLPGISVEVEPMRHFPYDSLAAHVLGYVGEITESELQAQVGQGYRPGSIIGKTGIERQYEGFLRGEDGIRFVEVNALGRRSEAYNREQPIPARPGRDVVLHLDVSVQREAERALDAALYDGEGKAAPEVRGAVVLLDVRTGGVLAMASRPGFDANVFSRSISQTEWELLTRAGYPLLNRSVQAAYPPGSVYKPLTLYAALVEELVTPGQLLNPCFGAHRFGNRRFRCWKASGHGRLNAEEALAQSCDVYFYQLAPALGVDGIARYARLFGLHDPTGIDLPQERRNLVPDVEYYDRRFGPRGWSRGVALNLIIGQGEILLTPVQLAQFTAILANRGKRVQPRLLKELGEERRENPVPTEDPVAVTEWVEVNAELLDRVRAAMRTVVTKGTGKNSRLPGIAVAGKTGTAENPGYDHALYTAFAPYEDPEVAVAVILENRGHGGSVAAPVAQRVLAAYFGIHDLASAWERVKD